MIYTKVMVKAIVNTLKQLMEWVQLMIQTYQKVIKKHRMIMIPVQLINVKHSYMLMI